MALDATLLTRNRVLGAKIEVTPGTALAIAAADCGLFGSIVDPKITPDIKSAERQGQQYLSKLLSIPGARMGKATFRTEFFGSGTGGTEPSWATVLLPACGMAIAAGVATPQTATATNKMQTCTIGLYQAGRYRFVAGCAGDFKIVAKAGEVAYIEWTMTGVWQSPSTTAIPTSITYPTAIPPRFAAATCTVGSQSMRFPSFEFSLNNKVYLRQDQSGVDGASVGTGYRAAIVTDRAPTIKIAPEAYLLSTLDFFAAHLASTTYSFSLTIGSVAGNQVVIAAPKAQLNEAPSDEDREGIMADGLTFLLTRNTGDDECSLTF